MGQDRKVPVAIIGSGNIGTDLMFKILRTSRHLKMGAMVGIDPNSDGLAGAQRLGVPVTSAGIEGFLKMPEFHDIATRSTPRRRQPTHIVASTGRSHPLGLGGIERRLKPLLRTTAARGLAWGLYRKS